MLLRVTSALDSSAATKINVAGKQRLLAQRTLTDAVIIDNAARTANWSALEPALIDLNRSAKELQAGQISLRSANGSDFTQATHAEADAFSEINLPMLRILKSTEELSKLTTSMIRRSPYIDEQTFNRVTAAKDEIAQAHAIFLPRMEAIVDLCEQEHKSKIERSLSQAKAGMLILMIVLIATILFVVEPTILIIRRQIKDLDKATRYAKRADATRWRLLTNMGHEFRTPMNAIMGFADLLNEDTLSEPERSRLVKSIYDSSTQLTHLIESMLDMSAIEAGQLRIIKNPCDFRQILTQLQSDMTSLATHKKLELNFSPDESCPKQITSDAKRIEQILYNLIENAIKFTQEGGVNIEAALSSDQSLLEIRIIDTGIGIKEEDQKLIFDPFRQAEDSLTRNFGGAGLGLAISRDLARAMGGDVTVISIPGKGSTFTLTIDPGEIKDQPISVGTINQEPPPTSIESQKILIVDDAKDNRVLLQHILKRTGAVIEFAHDGQQAVDAINEAIGSNSPYALVLMDMQMPVLDGYHATVQLRQQGITTPIIALTAHALDGDREHCLSAGCDEYMTKPVNKTLLIESCAQLIARSHEQGPTTSQAA